MHALGSFNAVGEIDLPCNSLTAALVSLVIIGSWGYIFVKPFFPMDASSPLRCAQGILVTR
jgi:hypothetical protein